MMNSVDFLYMAVAFGVLLLTVGLLILIQQLVLTLGPLRRVLHEVEETLVPLKQTLYDVEEMTGGMVRAKNSNFGALVKLIKTLASLRK